MVKLHPADHSDRLLCLPALADHSDYDGESVEQAVDLSTCTAIEYHCKNTWVTLTTFFGYLSCISVTKKCYQIGFPESSLKSFFFS